MASPRNLWICLQCGEYSSGSCDATVKQCEQHMCQSLGQSQLKQTNFEKIRKLLADEIKQMHTIQAFTNASQQLFTPPSVPPMSPAVAAYSLPYILNRSSFEDVLKPCKMKKVESSSMIDVPTQNQVQDVILKRKQTIERNVLKDFVKSIKTGLQGNQIYFFVGKVLIAVNPYKKMDTIYSEQTMQRYHRSEANLPAHLYSIGKEALNGIEFDDKSQSIIILGESGAGKTETTKQIVNFLCHSGQLVTKLKNASPILDAFGNAKTPRNDNSSRYCKFFEILYNSNIEIIGGHFKNFMLEKSRIYCNKGRYHIFSFLRNASEKIKNVLNFNDELFEVENQDVKSESVEFDHALDNLGFDECQKIHLYRLIAGIFCLTKIEFEAKVDGEGCFITASSNTSLQHAAKYLSLEKHELITVLTSKTIRPSGENQDAITKPLTKIFAESARNTLAKTIYVNLHHWVVRQINDSIKPLEQIEPSHFIGILDMPGFECFENNSYEQLIINFVNESVQKFSIEHLMKNYAQNKHEAAADLIGNDENGILTLLDDECKLLVPMAKNLTQNIVKKWASSPVLVNKIHSVPYTCFTVRHFVCDVTYNTDDFMEKNMTAVSEDIARLSKTVLKCLGDLNTFSEKTTKRMGISEGLTTKNELKTLLSSLDQTGLSFIRCIKPNALCKSNQFDEQFIENQLENTGTTFLIENMSDVKKIAEDRILDRIIVERKSINCDTNCNEEQRYDKYNHFAGFDLTINSGKRCKVCKKTTFLKCLKCKASLCLLRERNCFLNYHQK